MGAPHRARAGRTARGVVGCRYLFDGVPALHLSVRPHFARAHPGRLWAPVPSQLRGLDVAPWRHVREVEARLRAPVLIERQVLLVLRESVALATSSRSAPVRETITHSRASARDNARMKPRSAAGSVSARGGTAGKLGENRPEALKKGGRVELRDPPRSGGGNWQRRALEAGPPRAAGGTHPLGGRRRHRAPRAVPWVRRSHRSCLPAGGVLPYQGCQLVRWL